MLVGSRAGQGIAARRQNPSAMRLLQLLALAAQLSLSSPQGSPPCPCGDPSLCRPLHPQPARPWEFVAFHTPAQPTHSFQGAGNGSDWRLWDWSKITTVAPSAPHHHSPHPTNLRLTDCPPLTSWRDRFINSHSPGCNNSGRVGGPNRCADNWEFYCHAHSHGVRYLDYDGGCAPLPLSDGPAAGPLQQQAVARLTPEGCGLPQGRSRRRTG